MIITNNAVFLHIPKTGGTWVRNVLKSVYLPISDKRDYHNWNVPEEHLHKPKFVFVRNPWSWYVSAYNYMIHGTDGHPFNEHEMDLRLLGFTYKDVTFEKFVKRVNQVPDDEWIRKSKLLVRMWKMQKFDIGMHDFWIPWFESKEPFYQYKFKYYLDNVTKIGTMENIRDDLESMLLYAGDLTPELSAEIHNHPKRNVGVDADYRTYYNEETYEIVRRSTLPIIEQFDYKF